MPLELDGIKELFVRVTLTRAVVEEIWTGEASGQYGTSETLQLDRGKSTINTATGCQHKSDMSL